jgi:hypothetical protein
MTFDRVWKVALLALLFSWMMLYATASDNVPGRFQAVQISNGVIGVVDTRTGYLRLVRAGDNHKAPQMFSPLPQ